MTSQPTRISKKAGKAAARFAICQTSEADFRYLRGQHCKKNMHQELILEEGNHRNANSAMVMLHGRGGNARDILTLSSLLNVTDFALYAPQASNNTWYPYSFLAPPEQNEPWLSAALDLVGKAVDRALAAKIPKERIYLLGFSQGACLAAEYAARNADRYGGLVVFTGGLIGDKIYRHHYEGDFGGTPVLIASSNPDFHVPVERVYATTNILKDMGADVLEKIYDNMGHTIVQEEINLAREFVLKNMDQNL